MFKRICFIICLISTIFLVFVIVIYPFIKIDEVIQIPNIIGLSEKEGLEILDNKDVKYNIVYIKGKSSNIVSTVPGVNSLIKKSQNIIVYIEEYEGDFVIDFSNMNINDAKTILEEYKKEYGILYEIEYVTSDNNISNIVIGQSVSDELLDNIDKIILTVNISNDYIKMPNFIMKDYKEAFLFCKDNGLIFEGIYITSLIDEGLIIYQEIEYNEDIRKNSYTRLLFYIAK